MYQWEIQPTINEEKTQVRRVLKPQPPENVGNILGPELYAPIACDRHGDMIPGPEIFGIYDDAGEWGIKCPYGQPGDQLWVRETWATGVISGEIKGYAYKASWNDDDWFKEHESGYLDRYLWWEHNWDKYQDKWRSSIIMPRWASRIQLKIMDIKVERVQDIKHPEIIAMEGVTIPKGGAGPSGQSGFWVNAHLLTFKNLWNSINKKRGYGWNTNPWVWVIKYKKVKSQLNS